MKLNGFSSHELHQDSEPGPTGQLTSSVRLATHGGTSKTPSDRAVVVLGTGSNERSVTAVHAASYLAGAVHSQSRVHITLFTGDTRHFADRGEDEELATIHRREMTTRRATARPYMRLRRLRLRVARASSPLSIAVS